MNLLRHTNYSNTLKLYRSNWWYSISFTYAPLHSQCDYRHAHLPPVSARLETKLRSQRLAKFSLRNTSVGHVDFNRGVSSNHPPVIEQRKGLFSDLQKDLNPYIRLVRFDRPIGKTSGISFVLLPIDFLYLVLTLCLNPKLLSIRKIECNTFFPLQDHGYYFGHAVGALQ